MQPPGCRERWLATQEAPRWLAQINAFAQAVRIGMIIIHVLEKCKRHDWCGQLRVLQRKKFPACAVNRRAKTAGWPNNERLNGLRWANVQPVK